jgi:hypothetical protein
MRSSPIESLRYFTPDAARRHREIERTDRTPRAGTATFLKMPRSWSICVVVAVLVSGCGRGQDSEPDTPRQAVGLLLSAAESRHAADACAVTTARFGLGCNGEIEEATAADAATARERGVRWTVRERSADATATLRRRRWRATFEITRVRRGWRVSSWQTFNSSG